MKCQRCGADIPKGEVFCFECGEEVQLVPDYNSLEYMMQQKQALEEQAIREEDERQRRQARQEKRELDQKKRKKKKLILITIVTFVLMAVAIVGVLYFIKYKQDNSFEYQYGKAYEAYEAKDYVTAAIYAQKALELSPNNDNAILLSAEIEIEAGYIDSGIELLLTYVEKHPESIDAYAYLISIYESEERYEEIGLLMNACNNDNVLTQFAAYIPVEIRFVTEAGDYTKKTEVEISFDSGTVYYTLDGTDPDQNSSKYTSPVMLDEGTTTFKAISYSEAGVPGEIIEMEYTVTLTRPNPPFISPASGEYEEGSEITVIYPDGCKAYYTFDGTATSSSKLYTEPITMLEGEHIFSVIVIDENGKQSYPASETYVVE